MKILEMDDEEFSLLTLLLNSTNAEFQKQVKRIKSSNMIKKLGKDINEKIKEMEVKANAAERIMNKLNNM